MTPPPALRPPAWAEKYPFHWFKTDDGHPFVLRWSLLHDFWLFYGEAEALSVTEVSRNKFSYWKPCDPSARVIDPEDEAMVECVERALENLPNHFYRENNLLPEPVWEICRYGVNAEPEIVVVCGYATEADAEAYMPHVIRHARAKAALTALKEMP